jgi:hypothetical protein
MREVIKQVLTTEQIDQGRKMQAVAFKEYYKMRCILPTISGMERGAKTVLSFTRKFASILRHLKAILRI